MQRLITLSIVFFIASFGCKTNRSNISNDQPREIVFRGEVFGYTDSLNVDFQEGFTYDSVEVILNGDAIMKLLLYSDDASGLADRITLPMESLKTLELKLSKRERKYSLEVDSLESNFLGIYFDFQKEELKYSFKKDPFLYE